VIMKAKDFRALFADLGSLTAVQRNALMAALSSRGSAGDVVALIEAEFAKAPACGHCGSEAFRAPRRMARLDATCLTVRF
jgi:hypothetical protein